MAVPKRKISKTRGRKRRTHWKAKENLAKITDFLTDEPTHCNSIRKAN